MRGISTLLFLLVTPVAVFGATHYVPDNFSTIQTALDSSQVVDGDLVLVRPGTYQENVYFRGTKRITLQSTDGADATRIDGMRNGSVVTMQAGSGKGSVLDGFTITNGKAGNGGGVNIESSAYTLLNSTVTGNSASSTGGGIRVLNCSPEIKNVLIVGNYSADDGGGLYCYIASPSLSFVTLSENTAYKGGGLFGQHGGSKPKVINSIIWGNRASSSSQIGLENGASPTITYTNIQGGWAGAGNKNEDPWFMDPPAMDFHLQQDPCQPGVINPCLDAGSDLAANLGVELLWTRTDGVPDAGVADMGYHYGYFLSPGGSVLQVPTQYPTIQLALTAASAGDTILVAPGEYTENVEFMGKPVILKSSDGPQVSVIDGGSSGSTVSFVGREGFYSVLDGFTVRNGNSSKGGGIYVSSASPRIQNSIIGGNYAGNGGGIYSTGTNAFPVLVNNRIAGNSAQTGGGIFCHYSRAAVINSLVAGNWAATDGGGLYCYIASPSLPLACHAVREFR